MQTGQLTWLSFKDEKQEDVWAPAHIWVAAVIATMPPDIQQEVVEYVKAYTEKLKAAPRLVVPN